MINPEDIFFEVETPLKFSVRVTKQYWQLITTQKHRILRDEKNGIIQTLESPDQIRRSRTDKNVYLFYRLIGSNKWLCAVTKRLNGQGFMITAYVTDAIKKGEIIWNK